MYSTGTSRERGRLLRRNADASRRAEANLREQIEQLKRALACSLRIEKNLEQMIRIKDEIIAALKGGGR